jgi:hypothetical protein
MTKELITKLYELSSRERTLTPAERETLQELRHQSGSELEYCQAKDMEKFRSIFDEMCAAYRSLDEDRCLEKAGELMLAGWTPEYEGDYCMWWHWRRPPRRAERKGRWFGSTDQAYEAMRKEAESR